MKLIFLITTSISLSTDKIYQSKINLLVNEKQNYVNTKSCKQSGGVISDINNNFF